MKKIKSIIINTPIIGKIATGISKLFFARKKFPGSANYWEKRYSEGKSSGSGSYNRLAVFKADVINSFIKEKKINSIIDFGCGDGNQLSLAKYPKYIGIDVSATIIETVREKFKADKAKQFFVYDTQYLKNNSDKFESELSLSIDVIFHLVEDEVFQEYLKNVFKFGEKYVIIYSSNFNREQTYHEKHRKFTDWVESNQKDWKLLKKIENKYKSDSTTDLDNTSNCDFFIYEKVSSHTSS